MSDVETGIWKNKLLGIEIFYIKIRSEFWFVGKECAEIFDFKKNTADALKRHIFYDYKLTFGDFLNTFFQPENRDLTKTKIKSAYNTLTHFWLQEKQILINELGFYQLASKSTSEYTESFQRWVYKTIKEIREKGYYCLPELEHLSLEEKKETIKHTTRHDIPEFVFGGDNHERNEMHVLYKDGAEKSKDLVQSKNGAVGGNKSSDNTSKAREFTKEVASKNIDDLDEMSWNEFHEDFKYLILKSRDIVKEFTT